MRVFIGNFGQGNYLWPECLRRSTLAIIDSESVHRFWAAGDRAGYIEFALANLKTMRMETPNRALASRWFGLNDVVASTEGDLWIHKEKEQVWWTTSRSDPVQIAMAPSPNPARDGARVFELHKPCEPWSDRSRKGARLSWGGLHPKARDFLVTEATLQQLSTENAEYALALVAGDDLEPWHQLPTWRGKAERTRKNPAISYDPRQKAIWRMADTVFNTVAGSNGQQVLRTLKDKRTGFDKEGLMKFLATLIADQDGLCALTGIKLQFDGDEDDRELLCSLDRIDSNGHYEQGNLQVVCRFANRWKNDSRDEDFRRLVELVRSTRF